MQTVVIKDILPDTDWMETEEGDVVFKKIVPLIKAGEDVDLSFEGGTLVLTPFLDSYIVILSASMFVPTLVSRMPNPNLR